MADGTPSEVIELQRALENATRDAHSSRFLAQLALGLAVLAGGAAWWVDARAASRAQVSAAEVKTLRAKLQSKPNRAPVDRLGPLVVESSDPRDTKVGSADPIRRAELTQLRERVRAVQARTDEIEGGFVAWGDETKAYVNQTSTRLTEEHRQERAEELRTLLARISALEARVGR